MGNECLVSIIIPCFNAERWICDAVDSCLRQTYAELEIIVIDDGSTDNSVNILLKYGSQIRLETGPNRGGSYARNRGFTLSKGKYIQFLDADDYILPEKIERQVSFLEETGFDAIYGDWRHIYHHNDGKVELGPIQISNEQNDILEALLRGWWTANMTLLLRREIVMKSGGWDESLQVGQDRDFFISVASARARITYQSGCYSIYRRYGNTTVSTSNYRRVCKNNYQLLDKAEKRLRNAGLLSRKHCHALAESYFDIAQGAYSFDDLSILHQVALEKAFSLNPRFIPWRMPWLYRLTFVVFGFNCAQEQAQLIRKIENYGRYVFFVFLERMFGKRVTLVVENVCRKLKQVFNLW